MKFALNFSLFLLAILLFGCLGTSDKTLEGSRQSDGDQPPVLPAGSGLTEDDVASVGEDVLNESSDFGVDVEGISDEELNEVIGDNTDG